MQIAIVQGDPEVAALLSEYLENDNHLCTIHGQAIQALEAFRVRSPDMILLDLMLPGSEAVTLCRKLREYSSVPVIMLTATVEDIDQLLDLEIGVDDYLFKPYESRKVVSRVRALFHRSSDQSAFSENAVVPSIDEQRASVTIGNRVSQLTALELTLLKTLLESPGRIFSRSQLIACACHDHPIVSHRSIDSHIKKLRQKLSALDPEQECIQSVYGVGYRYDPVPVMQAQ